MSKTKNLARTIDARIIGELSKRRCEETVALRNYYGTCPSCEEIFTLDQINIMPEEEMKPTLKLQYDERLKQMRAQVEHEAATKVGTRVGRTYEQIVPFSQNKYAPNDMKFIGQPIDFLIFNGMYSRRKLENIIFGEAKYGIHCALKPEQEQIKKQ